MSADNWTICPKCKINRDNELEQHKLKVESMYGTVTATEYKRILRDYEKECEQDMDNNLREDYYIGVDSSGEFVASYRGSCEVCGFEFEYSHKEKAL